MAHKELLPLIKEKNTWSVEKCDTVNLLMSRQPVGAGGEALGAVAVVTLGIVIEERKESQQYLFTCWNPPNQFGVES